MTNRVFSFLSDSSTYKSVVSVFLCASFLSGCVGLGNGFDCNVSSDGSCAPMSTINDAVDKGFFSEEHSYVAKSIGVGQGIRLADGPRKSFAGSPIRSVENVQQIWIAPYEDSSGNYNDASHVYTIVKGSKWLGDPVSAIQD